MGCGGSTKPASDPVRVPEVTPQIVAAEHKQPSSTWATTRGTVPFATAEQTSQRKNVDGGPLPITDADSEAEIEFLGDGKVQRQANHAANGQEAPKTSLSKRQLEEAARLAERRKRFDNEKYQRESAASEQYQREREAVEPVNEQQNTYVVAKEKRPPATECAMSSPDVVMGLNLEAPGPTHMADDALPWFVSTPRLDQPVKQVRNDHDAISEDDERIMSEILETVDA
mmetsp:Transcript_34722/g.95728  ORF Transcript_34722/g.95728 Transcript_34722/m.95728 type:complete len:228 (-) Transcript_34722:184-867(-)